MSITAAQYLNNSSTEKSYTGVFHYTRPVRVKKESPVEVYGLLSVSSEVEIPSANLAKFAWDGLIDGLEYSKEDSMNDSLKTALTEATRRVKQLIANDKNISDHGVDINFSVFVSSGNGLYVGCLGDSDIYIYKRGKLVDIFEMLSKKNAKTAGLVIEEGDVLFSSTKGFLRRNFDKFVGLPGDMEVLESLDTVAGSLESGEGLIVIIKEIEESKDVKEEEVVEPVVVQKELLQDTDSIPVQKPAPKESDEKVADRDLRKVLSNIRLKVSDLLSISFSKIKPVFKSVGDVLSRFFLKFKYKVAYLGQGISSKLGNKRWFKKVSATVTQTSIRKPKGIDPKGVRVDGYKVKNKKIERFKIAGLVLLGIIVIVGGVKFTMDQKEAIRVRNEANGIFTIVDGFVNQAEEKSRTDRQSTETFVFRAQEELKKVPENLADKEQKKLEDLEGRVLGIQDSLYKKTGLVDSDGSIETYVDSRLAFGEGSNPTDIAIYQDDKSNEYLLVADPALKGIYRVSLYDKEVKRLPDTNGLLKEPTFVYVGRSGVYVLDLSVGVLRAEFDSEGWFKPFEALTGLGIENIGADDIAEFAVLTDSDNVYVLDRAEGALFKSSNVGSGYGLSYSYIKDDSFTNANDVLADLSVYILTSGSEGLHRYVYSYVESKQVPAPLEVLGIDGEFKDLTYGYTRDNLNYDLYLFDSEDKRLFRFEKPSEGGGEVRHPNQIVLKNQYVYRGSRENVWGNVKDFVVNREQKFLYILDSSTVWKVRL